MTQVNTLCRNEYDNESPVVDRTKTKNKSNTRFSKIHVLTFPQILFSSPSRVTKVQMSTYSVSRREVSCFLWSLSLSVSLVSASYLKTLYNLPYTQTFIFRVSLPIILFSHILIRLNNSIKLKHKLNTFTVT